MVKMSDKCKSCGKCCLKTEMILSQEDVELILKHYNSKLRQEDFVFEFERFFKMKNIEGHCFFFDNSTKQCMIYKLRPQGCRFYPLIFDKDKKLCIFDEDCHRSQLFYQSKKEYKKICKKLKDFIKNQLKIEI